MLVSRQVKELENKQSLLASKFDFVYTRIPLISFQNFLTKCALLLKCHQLKSHEKNTITKQNSYSVSLFYCNFLFFTCIWYRHRINDKQRNWTVQNSKPKFQVLLVPSAKKIINEKVKISKSINIYTSLVPEVFFLLP